MAKTMRRYAQMSDEIEHLDVELSEILAEIRQEIEGLEWDAKKASMSRADKDREVSRIKGSLDKAKGVFQNFKVELRELGREELATYEPKARSHQAALDELLRNLNFAKSQIDKAELMGERAAEEPLDNKSAAELIEKAKQVQAQDADAVGRMQQMVAQSEETGVETNIRLKTQTEQLKNIHVDVDTVQANMKAAEKILGQMSRRLATDKMVACVVMLLLLGILSIIIIKIFGWDKSATQGPYAYIIDCNLEISQSYKECIEQRKP